MPLLARFRRPLQVGLEETGGALRSGPVCGPGESVPRWGSTRAGFYYSAAKYTEVLMFFSNQACATRVQLLFSGEQLKSFTLTAHAQRFRDAGQMNKVRPIHKLGIWNSRALTQADSSSSGVESLGP